MYNYQTKSTLLKDHTYSRSIIHGAPCYPIFQDEISVFEANIRFVGGLLSLYALTKDEVNFMNYCAQHICIGVLNRFLKLRQFMLPINYC